MEMSINVGRNAEGKKILFISDDKGYSIGELELSDVAFDVMFKELRGENK